ncbi:tyrosine-type recombinase/integrase [Phycisphaerales bacterium AB-hyl4]|uniref:Tyrosine-type recombinase/integrase n=1 Tax=Natronomicrosphaera hydrolytica TaxID=3242702 RepID=A0ABV4U2C6_9BACT
MAASTSKLPKLRRQKEKGRADRAFVMLDDCKVWCGRWGTEEAQQRYDRAIAEWLAAGRRRAVQAAEQVTVTVLVDRFLTHADRHYVHSDGTPTSKHSDYRQTIKPLLALYADLPATEFSPRCLRAVRQRMVTAGLARNTINQRIRLIRHIFKWAAAWELVCPDVPAALAMVEGLQMHRSDAPETEPVTPVADELLNAALPHLTPTLQAMVRLQRVTGMRPDEVCSMMGGEVDVSGEVWEYRPKSHKTAWRSRTRTVFIGPEGQKALRPYMKTDPTAPIFSPRQSERERREAMRSARKTPASCGNGPGDNCQATPRRQAAARWTTQSYGRAIQYACDSAFPPPADLQRRRVPTTGRKAERWETRTEWHDRLRSEKRLDELKRWQKDHRWAPNQLRHAYATEVRQKHGLEAAQVLLGHARADVTQLYAERDVDRARQVARQVG